MRTLEEQLLWQLESPQQRLQHRLEPAWRCRRLMGGGPLDRLRPKSGFTDLRSFLQQQKHFTPVKLENNLYVTTYVVTIVKGEEVSELDKRSQRTELGSLPFVCWESRDPQLRHIPLKLLQAYCIESHLWALFSFLFVLGGADLGRPLTLTIPDLALLRPNTPPVRPRSRLLSGALSSQSENDQPEVSIMLSVCGVKKKIDNTFTSTSPRVPSSN